MRNKIIEYVEKLIKKPSSELSEVESAIARLYLSIIAKPSSVFWMYDFETIVIALGLVKIEKVDNNNLKDQQTK